MPCPHAERRGALVYCRVAGKTVNPIAYPCLGTKYEACPYYKQAKAREEPARPKEERPAPALAARAEPRPAEPAPPRRPARLGLLGLTRLGGIPEACNECVFYAKGRSWCFILGSGVGDPGAPPCAEAA